LQSLVQPLLGAPFFGPRSQSAQYISQEQKNCEGMQTFSWVNIAIATESTMFAVSSAVLARFSVQLFA
jgi:hypothetical protein